MVTREFQKYLTTVIQFFGFGLIVLSGDIFKNCIANQDFSAGVFETMSSVFLLGIMVLFIGGMVNSKKEGREENDNT